MWGSQEGSKILDKLVVVYDHVVWESTALLVLRGNENFDITGHFGKEDLPKLTNSVDEVMVSRFRPRMPIGTDNYSIFRIQKANQTARH